MKSLAPIILFILCFCSCKSSDSDNAKRIRSINEIEAIDTLYEFKVDSTGRIVDTLSMRMCKKNEKGLRVFAEITSYENSRIVVKDYYRDNGALFYSVTETATGILSKYENWEQKGKIQEAISIDYSSENNADTVKMKFKYEKDGNGKVKKMTIYESGGPPISEIHYNQNEKPILEIYTYYNDTTSVESFTYEGSKLISKRILNKRNGRETLRYYGEDDFVAAEKVYLNDTLAKELVFTKDNSGNIFTKVIK